MSRVRYVALSFMVLILLAPLTSAVSTQELAEENAMLKQRLERVENELSEIKSLIKAGQAAPKQEAATTTMPLLNDEDLKKISKMVQEDQPRKGVWANLDMQFYGYIKADASYDDSRTSAGSFVKWVESENTNRNDNEFNMTARQTRLGVNISGPKESGLITSGRAEIDFYGDGASADNRGTILLRHAYLKLDWPEKRFNIIAGQTSDVISPLNPSTLNYTVAWFGGNIGYRHPQIRLTKDFALNDDFDLRFESAISRTIGQDFAGSSFDSESGEDSGLPTFQGRVALTFPFLEKKPTTVGVSGHWGREEYDQSATGTNNKKADSWSINLDVKMPINDKLALTGELFTGENLDNYFGGIGQGVNSTTFEGIRSTGGWAALSWGPFDKWKFNTGFNMEDVVSDDVSYGGRTENRAIFGNMIYSLNKNTDWGLELSQWHTERRNEKDADDFRVQTSFIYKF